MPALPEMPGVDYHPGMALSKSCHWLAVTIVAAAGGATAVTPARPTAGWIQGPHRIGLELDAFRAGSRRTGPQPVFVLLDGEQYADQARSIAGELIAAGKLRSILLVTVHLDGSGEQLRLARLRMFTTAVPISDLPERARNQGAATGEIRQFAANLRGSLGRLLRSSGADQHCMTLFGHSLAGHGALAMALDRPGDWRGLVAASPSLWWGRDALLRDPRLRRRPSHRPHLLITAGALEAAGDGAQRFRIVDNARALEPLAVRRFASTELIIFPGADHQSSVGPALHAGLVRAGQCWRRR